MIGQIAFILTPYGIEIRNDDIHFAAVYKREHSEGIFNIIDGEEILICKDTDIGTVRYILPYINLGADNHVQKILNESCRHGLTYTFKKLCKVVSIPKKRLNILMDLACYTDALELIRTLFDLGAVPTGLGYMHIQELDPILAKEIEKKVHRV